MDQIKAILENLPTQDSNRSNKELYSVEAIAHGYSFSVPEPAPEQCQFCGQSLRYIGLKHPFKKSIMVWLNPLRCTCEKAQGYWKEYDLEQARIKTEEAEQERKLQLRKKIERLFQQSRMGERFKERTFENYKCDGSNRKAFETAKRYAENFEQYKKDGIGLIFTGNCGTGKTHLAGAITIELLNKGVPVVFGTLISLLGKIKESYDSDESEHKILDLYRNVDLLVIDDIGKERPSEWVVEKLYSILNERYENNRPIIVTSNYNHETLKTRLTVKDNIETADAIISRLYEICRGVVLEGEDYRKK